MSLYQSISNLTGREQFDLRHIAKSISGTLQPLVVFCYGSRVSHYLRRSCFLTKKRTERWDTVYDLLIILDDNDPLEEVTAETVARKMIGPDVKTTLLVHKFSFIKNELLEGNFFFSWIHRSAVVLVNRNNGFLKLPPQKKKSEVLKMYPETYTVIKSNLDKAKSLLAIINEQWTVLPANKTLQLMEELVVEIMKAFIAIGLGYSACNYKLETLIRTSENFSPLLSELFPNNSPEERYLYSMLAERGSREVQPAELIILLNRIKVLKQKVNDYLFKNATVLKYMQPENNKSIQEQ